VRTTISTRSAPTGGSVLAWPRTSGASLQGKTRLTILVHGYNNTEADAALSYATFLSNTRIEDHPQAGHICEFYWPGDHAIPVVSAASYPMQIGRAVQSATVLREYLSAVFWNAELDVCLIAHSLGSRLVLEFVLASIASGRPHLKTVRVCLMAAAVPVETVAEGARLYDSAKSATGSKVLYSAYDQALGWEFRRGQAFAGEASNEAVGIRGGPASVWAEAKDLAPYSHGDYWSRKESAAEARLLFRLPTRIYTLPRAPIGRRLTSALGLPPLRRLPSRELSILPEY
jgi:Alpha/beta hydrolase of unknown function (DUF900)